MPSGLVRAFLPRSNFTTTVTICSDFGAQENRVCFNCFPIYLLWSYGTGCHDLHFWMLSFKTAFSLSSFTFIKMLFSFSSLSAIRVVSSVYLKLFIFPPVVLIPACASSSPAFLRMHPVYKLNEQAGSILDVLRSWFGTIHHVKHFQTPGSFSITFFLTPTKKPLYDFCHYKQLTGFLDSI